MVTVEIMIEGIVAELSLPQWNTVLGVVAAVVTALVGLIKLRKTFVLWFYLAPMRWVTARCAARDRKYAERIFEEMKPMLEQEILTALEGYTEVMQEQRITIASAIAENVEFRNYITGTMAVIHDTMTKVATAVERNACDAHAIRNQINSAACGESEHCDKRTEIKPYEEEK